MKYIAYTINATITQEINTLSMLYIPKKYPLDPKIITNIRDPKDFVLKNVNILLNFILTIIKPAKVYAKRARNTLIGRFTDARIIKKFIELKRMLVDEIFLSYTIP